MTRLKNLHEKWSTDPDYREAYDALAAAIAQARALKGAKGAANSASSSSKRTYGRPTS